jgi:polysaccharide deacetylase family protein (PEP-CTERM system associated)
MAAIFALLGKLNARATFFVLGITARNYPDIVQEINRQGFEIASHGFAHEPVHSLTPDQFKRDLEGSVETLEKITGVRPRGYRAPAFSINRGSAWAFEILCDCRFEYDSSQYDSPALRDRIRPVPDGLYRLRLPSGRELWEFPVTVCRIGRFSIPIAGGSYWRVLPTNIIVLGLARAARSGDYPTLYFHPYEYDPVRLSAAVPASTPLGQRLGAMYNCLRSNPGRSRIVNQITAVADRFELTTYEEVLRHVGGHLGPRTRTLSKDGVFV